MLFGTSKCNFFGLSPEDRLKTVVVEQGGKGSRRLFFNAKTGPKPEDVFEFSLAVDFAVNETFVGDLNFVKWGINCLPEYCKAGKMTTCTYGGTFFHCTPAELTVQMSLDIDIDTVNAPNDLHAETIKVYLVQQETPDSLFGRVGVLGLSPKSDFLTTGSIEEGAKNGFTFYLFAPKGGLSFLDYSVFYQHRYSHAVVVNRCDADIWEIGTAKLALAPGKAVEGLATLNFVTETFFNFKTADAYCLEQIFVICETITNCNDQTANFGKAQTLTITFANSLEIKVQPTDYLIYNAQQAQFKCLIAVSERPLELGLKLFERFPFSIHFDRKDRHFVLENEFEPVKRWSTRTIALIVGLISGILLCAILTVKVEREHSRIKIA